MLPLLGKSGFSPTVPRGLAAVVGLHQFGYLRRKADLRQLRGIHQFFDEYAPTYFVGDVGVGPYRDGASCKLAYILSCSVFGKSRPR